MSFPVLDWQFWVVSAVAGIGLWRLIKQFLPTPSKSDGCPGCDQCPPEKDTTTAPKLVVLGGGQRARH